MCAEHYLIWTLNSAINAYITLTSFSREKLIACGLPADRLLVKPNFLYPDPGPGRSAQDFALIVGRLAPEKGIATLLSAWARLKPNRKLKLVGAGRLQSAVRPVVRNSQLELRGWQTYWAVFIV